MYEVEGIGYDFIPRVLDRQYVDEWMKIGDEEALPMARRLVKEEGFLSGASSGTAMAAMVKYIKENNIGKGKRCIAVFPDNIRNYITKFINDDWMYKLGHLSEEECMKKQIPSLVPNNVWGQDYYIKDMDMQEATFVRETLTCGEAINLFKKDKSAAFPCRDETGKIVGVLTAQMLMSRLSKLKMTLADPIKPWLKPMKDIRLMSSAMPIFELSRVLERDPFVIVDQKYVLTS